MLLTKMMCQFHLQIQHGKILTYHICLSEMPLVYSPLLSPTQFGNMQSSEKEENPVRLLTNSRKLNREVLDCFLFYTPLLGIILVLHSWMKPGCIQIPEHCYFTVMEKMTLGCLWNGAEECREETECDRVGKLSVMRENKSLKVCVNGECWTLVRRNQNLFR